jgi:DNA polymerase-3 subunit epsilon
VSEIYTFIDLETTGLNHETDQIIEIAAVRTDLVREYGRFHTFVHLHDGHEFTDEYKFTEEITRKTGITTDDLAGGIHPHDMSVALDFFAGTDSTFVAHNAPFVLAFLAKLETEPQRFVCTRALAKLVEPDEDPSLTFVCARHGTYTTGHRRTMNNVLATIKVFRKLAPIAEARGIEYRNVVVNSPERPLTFVPYNAKVVEVAAHSS